MRQGHNGEEYVRLTSTGLYFPHDGIGVNKIIDNDNSPILCKKVAICPTEPDLVSRLRRDFFSAIISAHPAPPPVTRTTLPEKSRDLPSSTTLGSFRASSSFPIISAMPLG